MLNTIKRCKPLLGTYISITIEDNSSDEALINATNQAFASIEHIEKLMSFYDQNSELSYINTHASKRPCLISQEMQEVLSLALSLSSQTNGLFDISVARELIEHQLLPGHASPFDKSANWQDITLNDRHVCFAKPMVIDLGGIAKGYAVDYAFNALQHKVANITINAGGDIRKKCWHNATIAIKACNANGHKHTITTPMQNQAMATSASYYVNNANAAIINPTTQTPINDKRSISVFANSCMVADALTKVAFLSTNNNIIASQGATALTLGDNNANLVTIH